MARFHSPLADFRNAALAFSLCAALTPALAQTPAGNPNQALATVNGENVTAKSPRRRRMSARPCRIR